MFKLPSPSCLGATAKCTFQHPWVLGIGEKTYLGVYLLVDKTWDVPLDFLVCFTAIQWKSTVDSETEVQLVLPQPWAARWCPETRLGGGCPAGLWAEAESVRGRALRAPCRGSGAVLQLLAQPSLLPARSRCDPAPAQPCCSPLAFGLLSNPKQGEILDVKGSLYSPSGLGQNSPGLPLVWCGRGWRWPTALGCYTKDGTGGRGYSALLLSQDLLSVTLLILPCPAKSLLSCLLLGMKLKVLRYGERSLIWVWAMVNYNYARMTFLL